MRDLARGARERAPEGANRAKVRRHRSRLLPFGAAARTKNPNARRSPASRGAKEGEVDRFLAKARSNRPNALRSPARREAKEAPFAGNNLARGANKPSVRRNPARREAKDVADRTDRAEPEAINPGEESELRAERGTRPTKEAKLPARVRSSSPERANPLNERRSLSKERGERVPPTGRVRENRATPPAVWRYPLPERDLRADGCSRSPRAARAAPPSRRSRRQTRRT